MRTFSKQIEDLLLIQGNNQSFSYVLSDFTLDWCGINKLFSDEENLEDPSECLRLKRLIDPIIINSHDIIHKHDEFLEAIKIYSTWTYSCEDIVTIFNEFCNNPEKYALCGFLQLSTIIEFALGNVYRSNFNRQPPHLLKDLLKELRHCGIFDKNQIFILQILLGTSKGVNLRNLTWHGFVDVIEPSYLSFLLVIIVSYGKQLKANRIASKFRRNVSLPVCITIEHESFDDILQSSTIQNCNLKAWQTIMEFLSDKKYKPGVYLLLSQIEQLLRFIYGQVNNENVTAKINKYYIIMDSIFYGYLLSNDITPLVIGKITKAQELEIRKTHQRNKLLDFFPRSIFYMHYDLFYAAEGPRLRDKISHGEMILDDDCSEKIFLTLFQFSLLVVKFYDSRIFPEHFSYESIYMSNVIFYREFIKINKLIENVFENLEIPSALKSGKNGRFEKVEFEIESNEIEIHFRSLIETQIVKMMLKILETFTFSLQNFQESSCELFMLFEERKLSSSRRKMLENLISYLPNFLKGFNAILNLLKRIFLTVQKLDDKFENETWSKKIIRMLKQTLQLTQVYQKHFSINERNYFTANSKTCEFLSQIIDNNRHLLEYEYLKANSIL